MGVQPLKCICHSSDQGQSQEVGVEWALINVHLFKAEMKVMLFALAGVAQWIEGQPVN